MSTRGKNSSGFTLLESLLTMIIIGVVSLGVGNIMVSGLETYSLIADRRQALHGARLAVNMMTNELQTVRNPSVDISNISTNSISFISASGESITYSISGTNLLRGDKTLAANVMNQTGFQFFTSGGGITSDSDKVHRVHISVEVGTGASGHGSVMLNTNVYLRNRYYNEFKQI